MDQPRASRRSVLAAAAAIPAAALATQSADAAPYPSRPMVVRIADAAAHPSALELFARLKATEGAGIWFGHQHTTTDGVTVDDPAALTQSDVRASVGKYPAIFGWDGLAFDGDEKPGIKGNTRTANARLLAAAFVKSDAEGGVNTLSWHMPNFVTGNNFYDTTGDVVTAILPGGAQESLYRTYLDALALACHSARRRDGSPVPIIFRPFHENTGSWFWWGAGHAPAAEYVSLFRYTIDYLRDVRDVHNLVVAWSPNGTFAGNPDAYLRTYPGDDYVDVLGYDFYDNGSTGGSVYTGPLVQDLAMIVKLADERGKIPALTEFGASPAFAPSGNPNTHWYTDVLAAIDADAAARRIAYMLTWANFTPSSVYVPYPASASRPAHELLPDFQKFEASPLTVFAPELSRRAVRARAAATAPSVHFVTPWQGARLTTTQALVKVKVLGPASHVTFHPHDGRSVRMTHGRDGMWSATWHIDPHLLDNRRVGVSVTARVHGRLVSDSITVYLGAMPTLAPGWVDDFENYAGDNSLLADYYGTINGASLTLDAAHRASGAYGAAYAYTFATATYAGVSKSVVQDWSAHDRIELWLQGDGSANGLTVQLVADGVYFESGVPLSTTAGTTVSLPFSGFKPAPWDTAHTGVPLDAAHLAHLTQVNLYVGQGTGGATSGTFYLDDIHAV